MAKQFGDDDFEEDRSKEPAPPGSMDIELEPETPDDDEDDEDEPAPARQQDGDTTPRKAKRAARAKGYKDLEERARSADERAQRLEMQLQQLTGYVQGAVRPQQSDPVQALQAELDKVNEDQAALYRQAQLLGDKLTTEEYAKVQKKANELEVQKHRVMNRMVQAETQAQPGQAQQYIQQTVFQQQLEQRYPDLVNTTAGRWGMQRYQQLLLEGRQPGWETLDAAAEDARKQYGMATKSRQPAPTRAEQRQLEGSPKGGSGSGGASDQPRKIRLSKDQIAMVQAWNPGLFKQDEKKACQKWWNEIGKKHA